MVHDVVSIEWVCETLGCSRRQVFNLLNRGVLERAPRFGRNLRVYRASVDRALAPRSNGRKRKARLAPHAPVQLEDLADLIT